MNYCVMSVLCCCSRRLQRNRSNTHLAARDLVEKRNQSYKPNWRNLPYRLDMEVGKITINVAYRWSFCLRSNKIIHTFLFSSNACRNSWLNCICFFSQQISYFHVDSFVNNALNSTAAAVWAAYMFHCSIVMRTDVARFDPLNFAPVLNKTSYGIGSGSMESRFKINKLKWLYIIIAKWLKSLLRFV